MESEKLPFFQVFRTVQLAEDVHYHERSAAERVNARLKDEFGGRRVRVRGHANVYCHLIFGVLALAVDQLMQPVM